MLSQQLAPGDDYSLLKPAIGIHLLDFDLFQQPEQQDQAFWCFEMRDRTQPGVILGNELQLNLVELRKADRLGFASEALYAWVTLFEHWKEESVMANIAYQPVKAALEKLKTLSADEEAQRLAFVRERALHDEASLMKDAREEGEKRGIKIGEQRGKIKGVADTLIRQLSLRFGVIPVDVTDRLNTASLEQLEQWSDNILFAQTLEQVFESDTQALRMKVG